MTNPETPPTAPWLTFAERLANAREKLTQIRKKEEEVDLERQVAIVEAEVKYTLELGTRGEDWEMVDAGPEGLVIVKLGEPVVMKVYRTKLRAPGYKPNDDDEIQFVQPNVVFPSQQRLHEILSRRRGLLPKIVDACATLYGMWEDKAQKK